MKKLLAFKNRDSIHDELDSLYDRYIAWLQTSEEPRADYVITILGCEEPESLFTMCDILENPEQLQKLKDLCQQDSKVYQDSFRGYFNRDNILCAAIINDRTNSLTESLEILAGLSEDFNRRVSETAYLENLLMTKVYTNLKGKVDSLVKEIKAFNGTKEAVFDELKLGKVTSDRQTEILQSIHDNKLKVKELATYNDRFRQGNVIQVIQDFNDFCSTVFRSLYASQGKTDVDLLSLQKQQYLNHLESQIQGMGILTLSNQRVMDYSRFDLKESSKILFSKDYILDHYEELVEYCELILSKTNDSTPPASGDGYTTHVIKRRFGHLRLGLLDIKEGLTVICYAVEIGSNQHGKYRAVIQRQAEEVFDRLQSRPEELVAESSGTLTPTPTDEHVRNNEGGKKRKNKVGKGAERSRPQKFEDQGNISGSDSSASSADVELSDDTILEIAKKITLSELEKEAEVKSVNGHTKELNPTGVGTDTIYANYAKSVFFSPEVLYISLNKVKGVKESKSDFDYRKSINERIKEAKKVQAPVTQFHSSLKELMSLDVLSGRGTVDGNFVDIHQLGLVDLNVDRIKKDAFKGKIKSFIKSEIKMQDVLETLGSVLNSDNRALYDANCPKYMEWLEGLKVCLEKIQKTLSTTVSDLKEKYVIFTKCGDHESYAELQISYKDVLDVHGTNHFSIQKLLPLLKFKKESWSTFVPAILKSLSGEVDKARGEEFMVQAIDSNLFGLVENILDPKKWPDGSEENLKRLNQVTLELLCKKKSQLGKSVTLLEGILDLPQEFKLTPDQLEYLLSYIKQKGVDTFLCKHHAEFFNSATLRKSVLEREESSQLYKKIEKRMSDRYQRQQNYMFASALFHVSVGAGLDWYNQNNDQQEQSKLVVWGPQVLAFLFQVFISGQSTNK